MDVSCSIISARQYNQHGARDLIAIKHPDTDELIDIKWLDCGRAGRAVR
ncbi:MAG: hypothetical protein JOY91_06515 [Sinobacteraceae bacterium]|nr:hypothetical protein [Nevskiaceae bacterium]